MPPLEPKAQGPTPTTMLERRPPAHHCLRWCTTTGTAFLHLEKAHLPRSLSLQDNPSDVNPRFLRTRTCDKLGRGGPARRRCRPAKDGARRPPRARRRPPPAATGVPGAQIPDAPSSRSGGQPVRNALWSGISRTRPSKLPGLSGTLVEPEPPAGYQQVNNMVAWLRLTAARSAPTPAGPGATRCPSSPLPAGHRGSRGPEAPSRTRRAPRAGRGRRTRLTGRARSTLGSTSRPTTTSASAAARPRPPSQAAAMRGKRGQQVRGGWSVMADAPLPLQGQTPFV